MKMRTLFILIGLAVGPVACATHQGISSRPATAGAEVFELHMKQGLDLFAQKEYGKAAAEFRAAETLDPKSSKVHNYLGLCAFQQKDYDPALAEFRKAVELDPSFATAYNNLGGVYSMKLQFEKAEEMFKKALSLAPDMTSANYSLGMLLSNLGRRDEGAVYLAKGIALDPDYLEKHKELLATFTSPSFDMKEAYFAYAKAYALIGNVDKTVDYLEKARAAGFTSWRRILEDKEFERVRDDPRIQEFLK